MTKGAATSLDSRAFSVPSAFRHVPVDRLDVPRGLLSLIKKRGFGELGDFDSISHIEFRRYFRNLPSPTDALLSVGHAIENLISLPTKAKPQLEPTGAPGSGGNKGEVHSPVQRPGQFDEIEQSVPIYIPVVHRGELVSSYRPSVRLRNICHTAGIRVVGQLHGKTFAEFAKLRNCGKKTLNELEALVRTLQLGDPDAPSPAMPRLDPDILQVPIALNEVLLDELPLSARLASALRSCGYAKLGQLNGVNANDLLLVKNCGRKSIRELRELLARAEAGEFTGGDAAGLNDALAITIRSIDAGMQRLDRRDRRIVEERLVGNDGELRTLEDVGHEFAMTRERVRQIVKLACEKIRRGGGPMLARALEAIARDLEARVVPLTKGMLGEHHSNAAGESEHSPSFYARVLDYIGPSIPVWAPGAARQSINDAIDDDVQNAIEEWLRSTGEHPTTKDAFEHLRRRPVFAVVSAKAFLSIVRRARRIAVEFPYPDQPHLRLRRLRLLDVTFAVLGDSPEPLTPEEIIEQGRSRFGADAVILSSRGAENALAAHPDVFRLGPRAFGLRKHFASTERERTELRARFAALLKKENHPVSTIEVCEKQTIALPLTVNSYELAAIVRGDACFIDLGRRLFALAKWGIEEREHIKDLLPKIFSQADRPLTVSEVHERLTKFRSATPTGLTNILRNHPEIIRLDFDYYGLRIWGDSRNTFFISKRSIVERAIRRVDPPINFNRLCEIFRIPAEGPTAETLWETCAGSDRLRRAPERRSADTLLMHKAVSLEQALASIARALGKPAFAYELEWELRARFGQLFEHVRLQQLEERLDKSARFLRNANGAFFLDADLDLGAFDVDAVRAATVNIVRQEREILSSDQLLERLETQGFELEEMTRGILASVLRGSEELEEVGHQRFRAR